MDIMIITEDKELTNSYKPLISEHTHKYIINNEICASDFLQRNDINRFDLIFIGQTDQIEAVEAITAQLPKANFIIINNDKTLANHPNVLRVVDSPVSREQFREICYQAAFAIDHNPSENIVINCFKSLTFKNRINSKVPIEVKWRTMKAKELFTYLLVSNNQFHRKSVIQDMFWEGLDQKSLNQQLYTTVYEIRKTIERINIPVEIVNSGDKYMLRTKDAWLDYEVFESQLDQIKEVTDDNYERIEEVLDLYTDHLLEEENYQWAFNKRETLRFLWTIHMERLRDFYIEKNHINEAIILNIKMCEFLPNNTLVKDNLNKLYSLIGEPGI